ncbi:hypothetical protein CCS38_09665 [Streptomyces purpurogeneiscleroticus]|nr:hypothetical protein [Streptomyces purpurogeneiscleroticus]
MEEGGDRAVGCARFALAVSDAIGDLEHAVLESALDREADAAIDSLDASVAELRRRSSGAEVQEAATAVSRAAAEVRTAIAQDRQPDLGPLRTAGLQLVRTCPKEAAS